jgi:hypothetical protein
MNMKTKRLVLLFLAGILLFIAPQISWGAGENVITYKVIGDLSGKWIGKGDINVTEDVGSGIALAGEYAYYFDNLGIGGGLMYQFDHKISGQDKTFWFLPIYGLVKYRYPVGDWAPYAIGQIGVNAYYGNESYKSGDSLDGGFHWGLGAGLVWQKKMQLEVLYYEDRGIHATPSGTSSSYSSTSTGGGFGTYDYKVRYHTVGISLGYNFSFPQSKP